MPITELFPYSSDDDLNEVLPLYNAVMGEMYPRRSETTVDRFRAGKGPQEEYRYFGIRDARGLAGLAITGHWVDGSNPELQWLRVFVRADARRKGHGHALLQQAVDVAESEGRTTIIADGVDTVAAGAAFAEASGAAIALLEHVNVVEVPAIDRAMLEQWRSEGSSRAPGYELLSFQDGWPERFDARVAELFIMADEDMPQGDLDFEPMNESAETVRERLERRSDIRRATSMALHSATDDVVGFSEVISLSDEDPTLYTTLTMVHRAHRGHALGKWLKADSILRGLERFPDKTHLQTENAQSNEPMLGINNEIGFTPEHTGTAYQVSVEAVKDYLAGT